MQGDNDPLDVVEIGSATAKSGDVYKVKPLTALGLVDDGELDWKIIVINVDDPAAGSVNDVQDVERCVQYAITLVLNITTGQCQSLAR
jgi:inorganic pyrophosphatase